MTLKKYIGNCPGNVRKAAKYSVRRRDGEWGVGVIHETFDGEIWHPVSHAHPNLVEMVNLVKEAAGEKPGGAFYINEFRQVIVPAGRGVAYYFAGSYFDDLSFLVDEKVFNGKPNDDRGNPLEPGDEWNGPHPGIPYTLVAGGQDIRYEVKLSPDRTKRVLLSRIAGTAAAKSIASRIAAIKSNMGGRFYVNEFRAIFAPATRDDGIHYLFVTSLREGDTWFPPGVWEDG